MQTMEDLEERAKRAGIQIAVRTNFINKPANAVANLKVSVAYTVFITKIVHLLPASGTIAIRRVCLSVCLFVCLLFRFLFRWLVSSLTFWAEYLDNGWR